MSARRSLNRWLAVRLLDTDAGIEAMDLWIAVLALFAVCFATFDVVLTSKPDSVVVARPPTYVRSHGRHAIASPHAFARPHASPASDPAPSHRLLVGAHPTGPCVTYDASGDCRPTVPGRCPPGFRGGYGGGTTCYAPPGPCDGSVSGAVVRAREAAGTCQAPPAPSPAPAPRPVAASAPSSGPCPTGAVMYFAIGQSTADAAWCGRPGTPSAADSSRAICYPRPADVPPARWTKRPCPRS